MLVLTRKIGEAIICTHGGETMRIIVSEIRKNQVKIAIDAPTTWLLDREEISERRTHAQKES